MRSIPRIVVCALMAVAAIVLAPHAHADALPAPAGRVILEVSGALSRTNGDGKARFDRAALEAMASHTLTTSTPWTKGVQTFDGFPLAALLAAVGASGTSLKAIALNDYAATLPIADSVAAGASVAIRQNGEPMSVRDRGPLWIVFPYDSDRRLTTDAYLNRSVWQIRELVVD